MLLKKGGWCVLFGHGVCLGDNGEGEAYFLILILWALCGCL